MSQHTGSGLKVRAEWLGGPHTIRAEGRQHTVDPEVVQRTTGIGGLQPGLGRASPSSPHPGRGSGALIQSTHRQGLLHWFPPAWSFWACSAVTLTGNWGLWRGLD